MLKFLLPLALIAGTILFWKLRATGSGVALRRASRPVQNDQIEALLGRLAQAAGIERIELRLLPDPSINGLATDTGEIYITEGLFDTFRQGRVTAQELSSVAAHEIGHLALGHMRRRLFEVAGRQAAQMVLGGLLGRLIPLFGGYIAGWLMRLVTSSLSRRDEFEADAYATALMIRAGLGAESQATMLEKLPRLSPEANAPAPMWLQSHPPVTDRAAAIRTNATRWKDHAPAKP